MKKPAKVKKPTPNQMLWAKQAKRIKAIYAKGEKEGYLFDKVDLTMPERVTRKSIEDLKELTPNKLYLGSVYIDPYSGVQKEGAREKRQREFKKRRSAQRNRIRPVDPKKLKQAMEHAKKKAPIQKPGEPSPSASTVSLELFIQKCEFTIMNTRGQAAGAYYLRDWINSVILSEGREAAEKMLKDAEEGGLEDPSPHMYGSDDGPAKSWAEKAIKYLPNLTPEQKLEALKQLDEELTASDDDKELMDKLNLE